jgi:hypothetical protein
MRSAIMPQMTSLPLLKGLVPTDLLQFIFHWKTFTSVQHTYKQGRRNGIGLLHLCCHKQEIQVRTNSLYVHTNVALHADNINGNLKYFKY